MRILVTSYGTEGDTRPMAALTRGLIEAGHDAVLLGDASGEALAQEAGVRYGVLAGDIRGAIKKLIAGGTSRSPSQAARSVASLATSHTEAWMREMLDRARACDGLVFSGLTSYAGLSVAEHLGIPAIGAGLQPAVETHAFPNPFLPPIPLPRFFNRLTHRLVMELFWRSFRGSINAARKRVTGQSQRQRMWRDYPIVLGISPQLVPRPEDWPERVALTGDWPLPGAAWSPSKELEEFLGAGEQPVYAGFGSMVGFDRAQTVQMLIGALRGRRALLSGGWNEMDRSDLPPNIMPIGPVPHEQLFPRVAVAVHHGGAGTSHAASRAGVPSVVVPFAGDQFFWGNQLARVGVAPPPIPHARLDAGMLGRRIDEASSERIRGRAEKVGGLMRREEGVRAAVVRIEECLRTLRPPPV